MDFLFRTHRPTPMLRPYVQSIWYARGQVPYRQERILPTGTIVLLINLGPAFQLSLDAGAAEAITHRQSWVCGLQSRFMVNRPLGETHMVGVTFRLAGAYPILGLPLRLIADDAIETEALWGPGIQELRARLQDAVDPPSRFAIVERALLTRLRAPPERLAAVRWAAARLATPSAPPVSSLADRLGLSHKHLVTLFGDYVGQPPKTIDRIARFNRALESLRDGPGAHWEQTALACGYYDQAHFNRDFRAFSGLNPSAYLSHRAPYHDHGLTPGKDGNFVPLG